MSFPIGSALPGTFFFLKNGVLTDPAVAPVLVAAIYPDGTLLTPLPALVHIAPGLYHCPALFTAEQATQIGDYVAFAATTDATVEHPTTFWSVEVQATPVIPPPPTSVTTSAFSEVAETQIAAIKTQLDVIQTTVAAIQPPANALTIYPPSTAFAIGSLTVEFVPAAAA